MAFSSRPPRPEGFPALVIFGSLVPCEIVRNLPDDVARRAVERLVRSAERVLKTRGVEGVSGGRATTKGTTLRLDVGGRSLFAKHHRMRSAYEAEISCYRLLGTSSIVPDLVGFDDRHRILVTSYVEGRRGDDDLEGAVWHFAALGRVHALWERACEGGEAFGLTVPQVHADSPVDGAEWDLVASFRKSMLHPWVPLSLADMKAEHVVGSGSGRKLVDFEQTAAGRFDIVDVVLLAAQIAREGHALAAALASYDEGRLRAGSRAPRILPRIDLLRVLVDRADAWFQSLNAALVPSSDDGRS